MIGLLPILARWRWGLGLAGGLAALGMIAATWHYRKAYHAEQALRKADHALYMQVQQQAWDLSQQAIADKEAEYNLKAMETDLAYRTTLADARSAADRYIASHRVRRQTTKGTTGETPGSTEGNSTESTDRSSAEAVMVAVSDSDILICTDNTKRLEAARDWALGLEKKP
jgi:glutathione S-transferase